MGLIPAVTESRWVKMPGITLSHILPWRLEASRSTGDQPGGFKNTNSLLSFKCLPALSLAKRNPCRS